MHKNNNRLNAVLHAGNVRSQSTRTGGVPGIPDMGILKGATNILNKALGGSKESEESTADNTTEAVDNSSEILRIYNSFISDRADRVTQLNVKREEAEKCANIRRHEIEEQQKLDLACAKARKDAVDQYLKDQSAASDAVLIELKEKLASQKALLDTLLKAKGNASNENDAKNKALQDQLDATKIDRADEIARLTAASDLILKQTINDSESAKNAVEERAAESVSGYVKSIADAKEEARDNEKLFLELRDKCITEQKDNADKSNERSAAAAETVAELATLKAKYATMNTAIDELCKMMNQKREA